MSARARPPEGNRPVPAEGARHAEDAPASPPAPMSGHAMAGSAPPAAVRVWDAPVRVFHWLLAASFAGAWLTADGERWRLVHVTLGYTMAALVVFRLLWGVAGTRHARFGDFMRGPAAVLRYLRSLAGSRPEHHSGHNPAGGWAVLALLGLTAVTAALGWATYSDLGGEWLEDGHEAAASLLMAVVLVHIAAVLLSSWLHKENLIRAMFTGRKRAVAAEPDARPWRPVAALLLAGVIGFWAVQWQQAPARPPTVAESRDGG